MKVQVIFNGSYPVGTVSTHRVHHMCKGLIENGVEVDLLIVHPTEAYDNIKNHEYSGSFENVNYRYICKNTVRNKNKFISKLIDAYSHFLVILQVLFNPNVCDVFIVIGPSLDFRTFLPIVTFFAKAKILLEINEYPFLGNAKSVKQRTKRWIWFNFIVPLYDGFIVISEELGILMSRYKSKKSVIIKIPILGDFSRSAKVTASLIKEPYMIHAGSLSESKDGMLGILKAYTRVIDKSLHSLKFVITGNTKPNTTNQYIHDYIKENNLSDKIIFTGFISNEEMENYLDGSLFAVINKYNNLQNKYCFSTKLAEYIKHGVPIIATKVGEIQAYLVDGKHARLIVENNTDVLVETMIEIIDNTQKRKQMAENAFVLIEKDFNYVYQGKVLMDALSLLQKQNKIGRY